MKSANFAVPEGILRETQSMAVRRGLKLVRGLVIASIGSETCLALYFLILEQCEVFHRRGGILVFLWEAEITSLCEMRGLRGLESYVGGSRRTEKRIQCSRGKNHTCSGVRSGRNMYCSIVKAISSSLDRFL